MESPSRTLEFVLFQCLILQSAIASYIPVEDVGTLNQGNVLPKLGKSGNSSPMDKISNREGRTFFGFNHQPPPHPGMGQGPEFMMGPHPPPPYQVPYEDSYSPTWVFLQETGSFVFNVLVQMFIASAIDQAAHPGPPLGPQPPMDYPQYPDYDYYGPPPMYGED